MGCFAILNKGTKEEIRIEVTKDRKAFEDYLFNEYSDYFQKDISSSNVQSKNEPDVATNRNEGKQGGIMDEDNATVTQKLYVQETINVDTKESKFEIYDRETNRKAKQYANVTFTSKEEAEKALSDSKNNTQEPKKTISFYHGGLPENFNIEELDVNRLAKKQQKKGRNYAGFYLYDETQKSGAETYANQTGKALHRFDINEDAKILELGNIERVTQEQLDDYRKQGYDLIKGTDVRGRTEYVLLNKKVVQNVVNETQDNTQSGTNQTNTDNNIPKQVQNPASKLNELSIQDNVSFMDIMDIEETPVTMDDGSSAVIKIDKGGKVEIHSKDKIQEVGNIEDVFDKNIEDYGVKIVENPEIQGNYTYKIGEDTLVNRYDNPEDAINYDDKGNVESVDLEKVVIKGQYNTGNPPQKVYSPKKVTGEQANKIAINIFLEKIQQNGQNEEFEKWVETQMGENIQDDAKVQQPASKSPTGINKEIPEGNGTVKQEKLIESEPNKKAPNRVNTKPLTQEKRDLAEKREKEKYANKVPKAQKINSYKTAEGSFDVYDIEKNVPHRGNMFTVEKNPDGWIIRDANVPEYLQRKGIATDFYDRMNKASIAQTGKPLRSSTPKKISTGEKMFGQTKASVALWEKFVKSGEAIKTSTGFRFKTKAEKRGELSKYDKMTPEQRQKAKEKIIEQRKTEIEKQLKEVEKRVPPIPVVKEVVRGLNNLTWQDEAAIILMDMKFAASVIYEVLGKPFMIVQKRTKQGWIENQVVPELNKYKIPSEIKSRTAFLVPYKEGKVITSLDDLADKVAGKLEITTETYNNESNAMAMVNHVSALLNENTSPADIAKGLYNEHITKFEQNPEEISLLKEQLREAGNISDEFVAAIVNGEVKDDYAKIWDNETRSFPENDVLSEIERKKHEETQDFKETMLGEKEVPQEITEEDKFANEINDLLGIKSQKVMTSVTEVTNANEITDNTPAAKIAKQLIPTLKKNGFKLFWHSRTSMENSFGKGNYAVIEGKNIHLRQDAKGNSLLHEMFHPIVAEIIFQDEELKNKILDELQNSKSANIAKAREFAKNYKEQSQSEEGVTEALANVALDAMIEFANKTPNFFTKVIRGILKNLGLNQKSVNDLISGKDSIESIGKALGEAFAKGIVVKKIKSNKNEVKKQIIGEKGAANLDKKEEATAKALEGVEKTNKSLWDKIKDLVNKISQKLGGISDSQHINDFKKAKTEWSKLSRKEKQLKRADYELDGLSPSEGGYYKVGDVLFDLDLSENIFSLLISGKKLLSILPKLGVTTFNAENRPAGEMFAYYSDGKIHLNNNSAYENIRQLTRAITHELGHHEFTKLSEKEKDYVNSLSIETGMALQYKAQGDGKQTSASLEEENFADYVMQYFQGKLYGDETLLNKIPERLRKMFDDKYGNLLNENNDISEAYHKAKADGSNPELVKAVEDLLGKPTQSIPEITPLTEKEFYKKFKAIHKDIRTKGESKSIILSEGFKEGNNINALPFYKGYEIGGNIISTKYGAKEGDFIWLLPKEGFTDGRNGYKTKEGYVPDVQDGFFIQDGSKTIYENYLMSFDKNLGEKQQSISESESIKEQAISDGTFMKAPNGKPSKLNEKQWIEVRTKAFKDWSNNWKDSVKDENGEPQVLYTGSPNLFTEFDREYIGSNVGTSEGRGFYFTSNKRIADGYAEKGVVYEVFVNIGKNISYEKKTLTKSQVKDIILRLENKGIDVLSNWGDVSFEGQTKVLNEAVNAYFDNDNDVDIINSLFNDIGQNFDLYDELVSMGYKGTEIKNADWGEDFGGQKLVVAFASNQIKSATENLGTFDTNNPDIRYQKEVPQEVPRDVALQAIKNIAERENLDDEGIKKYIEIAKNKYGYDFTNELLGNNDIFLSGNPAEIHSEYLKRLLSPENNAPQEIVDYVKSRADKTAKPMTSKSIVYLANKVVDNVVTKQNVVNAFEMLKAGVAKAFESRTNWAGETVYDENGWEITGLMFLAKRASLLGYNRLAGEIELYIAQSETLSGRHLWQARAMYDTETNVWVHAKRATGVNDKILSKKNEITGKAPIDQIKEFLEKIKIQDPSLENFKKALAGAFQNVDNVEIPGNKKNITTKDKAQKAYTNYKRLLRESRGTLALNINTKMFAAGVELMKFAYYSARGSVEDAITRFKKQAKIDNLEIDPQEILQSNEFKEFQKVHDEELKNEKVRQVERLANKILNPEERTTRAESLLAAALKKAKQREAPQRTTKSIYDDIVKNEVSMTELLNAKAIVDNLDLEDLEKQKVLNEIDDIIEKITGKSIGKNELRKAIATQAKDIGATIADLAIDRLKSTEVKKSLLEDIIETTGITAQEAKKYEAIYNKVFDDILASEVEKMAKKELDKLFSSDIDAAKESIQQDQKRLDDLDKIGDKSPEDLNEITTLKKSIEHKNNLLNKAQKSYDKQKKREEKEQQKEVKSQRSAMKKNPTLKRLVDLVKRGTLSDKELANELYEWYGITPMSEKDKKEVERIMLEYDTAKRSFDKRKAQKRLIDLLDRHSAKAPLAERLLSGYMEYAYANMLNSAETTVSAFSANVIVFLQKYLLPDTVQAIKSFAADMIIPEKWTKLRNYVVEDPKAWRIFTNAVGDGIRGLISSGTAFMDVMKTGDSPHLIFDVDTKITSSQKIGAKFIENNIKKALDLINSKNKLDNAKGLGLLIPNAVVGLTYIMSRSLIGIDIVSKAAIIPYLNNRNAYYTLLDAGYDKTSVDLVQKVEELAGKNTKFFEALEEDVKESGLKNKKDIERYRKTRYFEILPDFVDKNIWNASLSQAEEMAMQGDVHGTIGRIINPIITWKAEAMRSGQPLKMAGAFGLTLTLAFARVAGIGVNLTKSATPLNLFQIKRDKDGKAIAPKLDYKALIDFNNSGGEMIGLPRFSAKPIAKFLSDLERREERTWSGSKLKERRDLTPYEIKRNRIYAIGPTLAALALFFSLFDLGKDDDDDLCIKVDENIKWRPTGNQLKFYEGGTLNGYAQSSLLKKHGDKWVQVYSYKNDPTGVVFVPIGTLVDKCLSDPNRNTIKVKDIASLTFKSVFEYISDFGWANAGGMVRDLIEGTFTALVGDEKMGEHENTKLNKAARSISRQHMPGGAMGSWLEKQANTWFDKPMKRPSGEQTFLGYNIEPILQPYSQSILYSWMFEKRKYDPYGQPFKADWNNKYLWQAPITAKEAIFGPITDDRPEYKKILQTYNKANKIGTPYVDLSLTGDVSLYAPNGGLEDSRRVVVVDGLTIENKRNIEDNTALLVKQISEENIELLRAIKNHAQMSAAQETIMDHAKSHAWVIEFERMVKDDPLFTINLDDEVFTNSKSYGILFNGNKILYNHKKKLI